MANYQACLSFIYLSSKSYAGGLTRQFISDVIQGSLNRDEVANSIKFHGNNGNIAKKVQWLKNWIKKGATKEELKAFLKFVTGSTSLSKEEITVSSQGNFDCLPFLKANTCFNQIKLAPQVANYGSYTDDTEEHFIQCVKLAIREKGFQFA